MKPSSTLLWMTQFWAAESRSIFPTRYKNRDAFKGWSAVCYQICFPFLGETIFHFFFYPGCRTNRKSFSCVVRFFTTLSVKSQFWVNIFHSGIASFQWLWHFFLFNFSFKLYTYICLPWCRTHDILVFGRASTNPSQRRVIFGAIIIHLHREIRKYRADVDKLANRRMNL